MAGRRIIFLLESHQDGRRNNFRRKKSVSLGLLLVFNCPQRFFIYIFNCMSNATLCVPSFLVMHASLERPLVPLPPTWEICFAPACVAARHSCFLD